MLSLSTLILTVGLALQVPGSYMLRGTILAPAIHAAERVEVVLERSQDRVVARALSDNNGGFEFRNLDAGRYEVVVRVEGYDEAREAVEIGGGATDSVLAAAAAAGDGQEQPVPPPEAVTGSSHVYVILHKKGAAGAPADSDPDLAVIAELSRKYPKKVVQEYERAVEFSRKGDLPHATERYEAVLKLAPDFYYGHAVLAGLYQRAERYRDAEREYNLARKLSPHLAQPLLGLGRLYMQEAEASLAKGPSLVGRILDQALDVLEEAIKLEPQSAMAHFLLGAAYYRSEFDPEAEMYLKRAIELDSAMGPARLLLANVFARQEKWQNSLTLLDAYLAQNPNTPDRAQIMEIRSKVEESSKAAPK